VTSIIHQGTRQKARLLGVARSTLWYRKKKPKEDWVLKCRIEEVLRQFPSYGHRRLALHLKINRKRVRRVMRLFGIKPYRRRGRRWRKPKEKSVVYPNLLMTVVPRYQHHVWVADFTHLAWKGRDVVVATTLDVYTRNVVGLAVATRGGAALVTQALAAALLNHPRPVIFHSDNGVEYNARSFRAMLSDLGIQISRSKKGCPWENGYQESFYDKFKVDLGDPGRFETLGELVYAVYQTVHAYNTKRIHSALKMAPREFARLHAADTIRSLVH
jgi:putative transposase